MGNSDRIDMGTSDNWVIGTMGRFRQQVWRIQTAGMEGSDSRHRGHGQLWVESKYSFDVTDRVVREFTEYTLICVARLMYKL